MAITSLRVKVGERWYSVQVGDLSRSPVEVLVEGETFLVELDGRPTQPVTRGRRRQRRPTSVARPPPQRRASLSSSGDNIIRAPMPGRVISIMVRPGDQVSEGDELCVVEAMKMEQTLRSSRSGVVTVIHVQPMDSVVANQPLIELE
ncbi:MAG: DUF2118 domain-containing protein [Chloroflexi bacterium]|nr:DUF2118 domain-containing protein [Chloroflexota bacterium]